MKPKPLGYNAKIELYKSHLEVKDNKIKELEKDLEKFKKATLYLMGVAMILIIFLMEAVK